MLSSAHLYGVQGRRLAGRGWRGEEDAARGLEGHLVAGPAGLGKLRPHCIPEDALGGLRAVQQAPNVGVCQWLRVFHLHMSAQKVLEATPFT